MPELENEKPELSLTDTPPEPEKKLARPLRRRKFAVPDKDEIAQWIVDSHTTEINNRDLRTERRKKRRNKLMGWMAPKTWPWKNAAQCYLPIMQIANLKVKGTIENSLKAIRPMMEAKAKQRRNQSREGSINQILDYQFFVENIGEANIDTFSTNFVEDEAVFGLVQYVKEEQLNHDVRIAGEYNPAEDETAQRLMFLKEMFNDPAAAMTDEQGFEWDITFLDDDKKERTGHVEFFDTDDGKVEAAIATSVCAFDGPSVRILDFDDVIFPARVANLQPPSSFNPEGAPWVDIRFRVNLDTIRRRIEDHTYDQLTLTTTDGTSSDWDDIAGANSLVGSGKEGESEKEQKDQIEGTQIINYNKREDRSGIMRFCGRDVNGDGLEEQCIIWILEQPAKLMKVALLSEIYPGIPLRRPIPHTAYIPIPNRVLGISNSELVESLQDGMQMSLEQHFDWGTITNMPWFAYRAASGLKAEPIYYEPGMGIPLDDPQRDISFPTFPQKDSTFSINTITLLQQFVEMVEMQSQASYGRVPTGKASAFRTTGTTVNLLAQSDSRAEQILRRAFFFYGGVFELMHRLNRRFLPAEKEIRVGGVDAKGEDAYQTIKREDLNVDVDWEFKATLLNTNKQMLSQNLSEIIMLAFTPVAFQAGLITIDKMYALLRDKTKALDFDPDKYWSAPPDPFMGPKLMAEDVISTILAGEIPQGGPQENPQQHLAKLDEFVKLLNFDLMSQPQAVVLAEWMMKIAAFVQQQQMMMQSLQAGGGMIAQGGGGPGGAPTTLQSPGIGDNAPVRSNELVDESMSGGIPQ